MKYGEIYKALYALHLACAEEGEAEVLLTTDDQFLRKAEEPGNLFNVRFDNPPWG